MRLWLYLCVTYTYIHIFIVLIIYNISTKETSSWVIESPTRMNFSDAWIKFVILLLNKLIHCYCLTSPKYDVEGIMYCKEITINTLFFFVYLIMCTKKKIKYIYILRTDTTLCVHSLRIGDHESKSEIIYCMMLLGRYNAIIQR